MAVSDVKFVTGLSFAEGAAILSPLIQEIASQREAQVGLDDEAAKYGFTFNDVLTPSGEITSMIGPEPARSFGEDEATALAVIEQGYSKGYKMQNYGLKTKRTKLFLDWIAKGSQLEGADVSVRQELAKFKEEVQYLVDSIQIRMNIQMARVFAEGFSITAGFGPGSAGGDGKALFAADHPIKKFPGKTYSNLAAGALTDTNLLAAIATLKYGVKTGNNMSVKTPNVYTLLVPRALETTARKLLNTPGSQAGVYAGTGNNANLLNTYSFQGSAVEIVVLDMLGEDDGTGNKVGGANASGMWFLMNKEYALRYKTFRINRLRDKEISMWKDDETDAVYTKITAHFEADHYDGAPSVVGYAGA